MPESRIGYRQTESPAMQERAALRYEQKLRSLLDFKMTGAETITIPIGAEAQRQWLDFSAEIEVSMRPGGVNEHLTDWTGKLPGKVLRVAGLFHLIDNDRAFHSSPIEPETMGQAIALGRVLNEHARVAYNLMSADEVVGDAKRVLAWLRRTRTPEISERDCFYHLRGHFDKAEQVKAALQVLEERFYVKRINQEPVKAGRPTIKYEINPSAF